MNSLQSRDVEVFAEAVTSYFTATTREPAHVRTAYLLESREPFPLAEFTGLITLTTGYRGTVCYTAPRGMVSHVLLVTGETDYSEAAHCDLVGEIANQFAGQAQRHFGEDLGISPPSLLLGRSQVIPRIASTLPFVIPIIWLDYESHLIVHLEKG
jgi:chemotaxis protein CheX